MEQSDVAPSDVVPAVDPAATEVAPAPQAPVATPVVAQQPSSASNSQQPEVAPVVAKAPVPLPEAVKALLIFVKARRVVGDADLDASLDDVEAALAAQDE